MLTRCSCSEHYDCSPWCSFPSDSQTTCVVVERPDTPVLPTTATPDSSREAAAVLIQRLLRGRAAQNSMYEGKTRRKTLIEELRVGTVGEGEELQVGGFA
jgi:hypothetical protein